MKAETNSKQCCKGDSKMKDTLAGQNKSIYIMYNDGWGGKIGHVFDSMVGVMWCLELKRVALGDFLRSDKAMVNIEGSVLGDESLDPENSRCYWVGCNVFEHCHAVCKAEVQGSEGMDLSDIQEVWISWSDNEPLYDMVHSTEQAVKEYFRSEDWLDAEDNIKEGYVVHYQRFMVTRTPPATQQGWVCSDVEED